MWDAIPWASCPVAISSGLRGNQAKLMAAALPSALNPLNDGFHDARFFFGREIGPAASWKTASRHVSLRAGAAKREAREQVNGSSRRSLVGRMMLVQNHLVL